MKRLLFRFLLFLGMLSLLARLHFMVVVVGVGVGMACMAFLHLLATPQNEAAKVSEGH
jgi:hypothetical protein